VTYRFLRTLDTPGIRAARAANGVGELWETTDVDRPADRFSPNETSFIAERDDDRVALFLMDYARRRRLKILARMSAHDLKAEGDLAARLATPGYRGLAERGFTLRLHAFDWNCPQHITPRFTEDEIEAAIAPLRARLRDMEAENARLRGEKGSLS
jgi:predicted pyridoxine 5'-phosphate oxidase superfamily flavin-nucleotide-binding protein